nr:ABC transporter permease [Dactylosporangium thailandense]
MTRKPWLRRLLPIASILVVLVLWQVLVTVMDIDEFVLPAPSAIAAAVVDNTGTLAENALTTLVELGIGYALGVAVGLVLAVAMTVLPLFRLAVYPLVVASQTIPKIAIAPLLILWFGVGLMPKVLVIALLAFFPVLINTVSGLESADRGQLELLRSVNASARQVYLHVRLPAAVPFLFAGLKLALTVSVIGAIVGEWVAANAGLGYLLIAFNASLQTRELFATLVVLVLISSVTFLLISVVERRLSWEARLRSTSGGAVNAKGSGRGQQRTAPPDPLREQM